MVQILPFRGLRYQLDQVESLENVTAPPYDVISSQEQQKLYEKHPANVVRLILNQKTEQDSNTNNVYTRSKAFWEQWLEDGTLALENKPCVYAYSQEWQGIERKGMIGLLQLEPLNVGKVLPHEFTLGGPKKDRLELMKSTLANLSQIFMIYSDPERALESLTEPYFQNKSNLIEAIDKDAVKHRLIPISDTAIHQKVQALFEDKSLLIADGHHRYETALILQQEIRQKCYRDKGIEEPPVGSLLCDYLMVFLTNMDDPGLKVYPTHRVLYHWPAGWDVERFESIFLKIMMPVEETNIDAEAQEDGSIIWEYWRPGMTAPLPLKLPSKPQDIENNPMAESVLDSMPALLKFTDVAQFEAVVIQYMFQNTADAMKADGTLGFYRDPEELDTLIKNGKVAAIFYMKEPKVKEIHQISLRGLRMPQKSTYFYPKLLSGLVFYSYANLEAYYYPNLKGNHCLSGVEIQNHTEFVPFDPALFCSPLLS